MSADAKVWQDEDGSWYGICDGSEGQLTGTEYGLTSLLIEVEYIMKQHLHWEIFQFGDGLGLRGFRAKSDNA